MSLDQDVPAAGDSVSATAQSPGALIRQGRERMHVSLDELAGLTKLSYHALEAMERDDYNALLEPVYVRGYYRKCAKVLNLPEQALLDAYQSRVAPKSPEAPAKIRLASGADLGSNSRLPVALAIGAALVAVVVCAVIWIARSGGTAPPAVPVEVSTPDATAPAPGPAPAAGESVTVPAAQLVAPSVDAAAPAAAATAAPAAESAAISAAAPAATIAPDAVATPSTAAPAASAATPAETPAETPAAPAAGQALSLSFSATSWVRVSDAKGTTAIDGLMRAGESKVIEGVPPFSVFLGNAAAAKVEYQGAAVDIAPYVRSNKTARFTVPATN